MEPTRAGKNVLSVATTFQLKIIIIFNLLINIFDLFINIISPSKNYRNIRQGGR